MRGYSPRAYVPETEEKVNIGSVFIHFKVIWCSITYIFSLTIGVFFTYFAVSLFHHEIIVMEEMFSIGKFF
jgi:hypothetical protein